MPCVGLSSACRLQLAPCARTIRVPVRSPRSGTRRLAPLSLLAALLALLVAACGGSASPTHSLAAARAGTAPGGKTAAPTGAELQNWPEFGLNPQRSDTSNAATGITAGALAHLGRRQVVLPGTADSSPIYLHGVTVAGAARDVIVLTTTYGKTLALDASSGAILWTFTPPGYTRWAGSPQITTASPIADPDRQFVYTASPNGLIHKLSLADGQEDARALGRSRSRATPPTRSSPRLSTSMVPTSSPQPAATSATSRPTRAISC